MRANHYHSKYVADRYVYEYVNILVMPKGYSASETSVHFIGYHFVWCPKYRRKVLVGKVEQRLKELIKEKRND